MLVAARRTRPGDKKKQAAEAPEGVQCAPLEPIRTVERELTRPDGTKLRVEVPVYPPFRLPDRSPPPKSARKAEKKKAS
jgi:hypothetical protein